MPLLAPGIATSLPARPLPLLSRLVLGAALTLITWQSRLRTRRSLAQLEAHRLADIGLEAGYVRAEVAKPFWRG